MEFSNRMAALKPSAIREILKVSGQPGVLSLAAGNPSEFPVTDMAAIAARIFEESASAALQYGISEGYQPLRELTAKRLRDKQNIGRETDSVIIVSGGQQGIELAAKALLNEGDALLCEAPSFIGALTAFRSYNANLQGVEMDEDGMKMDALEEKLKTTPRVKLIYTIPNFQNPTGRVLSQERRQTMLELARKYDVYILEDDPYGELRYTGQPVPSIKSMDDEQGRVIYVGSYSKVLSPGMRVGFLCARTELADRVTVGKQCSDVHSNLFFQMLVARYLEQCDLDAHIVRCRGIYREKRDRLAAGLKDAGLRFTLPDGGFFIWAHTPVSGFTYARLCGERKVTVVPGGALVPSGEDIPAVRLNFSLPTLEQLDEGAARLCEVSL